MRLVNGIPTFTPYDESIYYASGLSSGSDITLPNSESYKDAAAKDLLIVINEKVVEAVRDFSVPAGATKTYITTSYDLPNHSVVRFIKQ